MPAQRKRSRQAKEDDPDVKLDMLPKVMYEFVDETKKLYGQRGTGTTTPPSISSERSSPAANTSATDETSNATEKASEAELKASTSGPCVLRLCTNPQELTFAQAPLAPAHLKAAATHLRG